MLAHAVRVTIPQRAVDIVGTGGDRANTVNISTMAAVVIAGAGAPVVKHGNRAASSKCGAADLLEGLGVAISLPADAVARTVQEVGIGFCFAPVYHPSYRHAGPTRRELGIPTVFNFLGPLTNPAQPAAGAIGCGNAAMAPVMAEVFAARGADVLVFRGDDGLDELTTTTTSTVWEVRDGTVREVTVDPDDAGVSAVRSRPTCAAVTSRRTWRSPAPCSPAGAGPCGTRWCSTPPPGWPPTPVCPGICRPTWPPASNAPARPWTPARRRMCSTGGSPPAGDWPSPTDRRARQRRAAWLCGVTEPAAGIVGALGRARTRGVARHCASAAVRRDRSACGPDRSARSVGARERGVNDRQLQG